MARTTATFNNIRDIHDRTTGVGKKINWIEKNVTKSVKKSFDDSKQAYERMVREYGRKI